jgi:RNA polymerase sigma-70 factor (ECF subfamily)
MRPGEKCVPGSGEAARGDSAAFADMVREHYPRALRFACAFLGDRHLAEDLVQEALRRLYERREEYPLDTHFGPYLVKIVARLGIDWKRARKAEARWRTLAGLFRRQRDPGPATAVQHQETAALIEGAISSLPERDRACFLLTVCEGLSYREAGEALALSVSEVNNAVYRARTALRKTLGPAVDDLSRQTEAREE